MLQGVARPTLALTWLTEKPVWVDQWPLSYEKFTALHLLVKEQVDAGHIETSHSPWNTPDVKQQAVLSHSFFHQGYRALKQQFHLSNSEARTIVAACPDCQG